MAMDETLTPFKQGPSDPVHSACKHPCAGERESERERERESERASERASATSGIIRQVFQITPYTFSGDHFLR